MHNLILSVFTPVVVIGLWRMMQNVTQLCSSALNAVYSILVSDDFGSANVQHLASTTVSYSH